MDHLDKLPPAIALITAAFVGIGSILTLIGTLGLVRLPNFYDRLHAPTLGTSWGAAGVLLGSVIMFTTLGTRLVIPELFLGLMMLITTPVTLMVVGRAAIHRDRAEGQSPCPPRPQDDEQDPAADR